MLFLPKVIQLTTVSNSGCGAAGAVKSSDSVPRGVSVFVFVCARDGLLWCATHIVGMELNRNYDPTHDSIGKIQKQESSSAFRDSFAFAPFSSAVWWPTRWRNDTFIDSFNCVVPYFVKLIIQQCGHRLSGGQKDTGAAIEQMFNNSENFLGGKDKIKYKNICNVLPTSGLVQSSVFATRKHWYTLHTTHVYTEVIFGWKNLTLNWTWWSRKGCWSKCTSHIVCFVCSDFTFSISLLFSSSFWDFIPNYVFADQQN